MMEQKSEPKLIYGFEATDMGEVLVATSDIGVAAVLLGNDRGALVRQLHQICSGANCLHDQAAVGEVAGAVALMVANPCLAPELALDLQGSEIELAVWRALRAIPLGETRSYGAVAKALPVAATAQEVGAACATNRIALLVPCHRVVKADGSISGYRWGVDRKRRLLNREACA